MYTFFVALKNVIVSPKSLVTTVKLDGVGPIWWGVKILSKFQFPSCYGLGEKVI